MRYVGVDLHSNNFTVCYLNETGHYRFEQHQLSRLAAFHRRLQPEDWVAVEATGNVRYFCTAIQAHVAKVIVVHPGQFEVIKRSAKKTDEHDAKALALFLSKDLLPAARLKAPLQAQVSSVAQTRDKLVQLRTTLRNKIRGILIGHGRPLRKEGYESEAALREVFAQEWEGSVRVELEVLAEQIRSLSAGIRRLERELAGLSTQLPGYQNLTSIKGIGVKSAAIFLSVIGDVRDFPSADKLASYFGIVPRVARSNHTEYKGRITKRGSRLGRTTLVQCTLIAKRYSSYLQRFYERIKKRGGSGKAIIATARKFLGVIYRTLKYNWVFADFPNFVLATP